MQVRQAQIIHSHIILVRSLYETKKIHTPGRQCLLHSSSPNVRRLLWRRMKFTLSITVVKDTSSRGLKKKYSSREDCGTTLRAKFDEIFPPRYVNLICNLSVLWLKAKLRNLDWIFPGSLTILYLS